MEYYVLFNQAEDGCYGDFVIYYKLYTKEQAENYIKQNATMIYEENDKEFVNYWFKMKSTNKYGIDWFYFKKFTLEEENGKN
jgi:hypothetical protein